MHPASPVKATLKTLPMDACAQPDPSGKATIQLACAPTLTFVALLFVGSGRLTRSLGHRRMNT